jgi:hypothetical protein
MKEGGCTHADAIKLLAHVSTVFECPPFDRCWGQTGHRDRAKMERMTPADMGASGLLPCKRSWTPFRRAEISAVIGLPYEKVGAVLSLEEGNATTRFHQSNCLFSRWLAARRPRTEA